MESVRFKPKVIIFSKSESGIWVEMHKVRGQGGDVENQGGNLCIAIEKTVKQWKS